ncbi:MAG TPA: flagellar hook-basal body complex protein FliE [Oligoflexia bacterium]|nr:flagellar hook-basal body complex protein FliE [Oligoflexia bacterium]
MSMTIERIGQFVKNGDVESIMDQGRNIERPTNPSIGAEAPTPGAHSFSEMLHKSFEKVNEIQNQADTAVKEMVAGRNKNIHETMLLMEKADMSFRMLMQVRNKVLEAYREVMRMQV